ncbi:hypothetical protein BHE74_00010590, partial [Ensete ventricosum]
MVELMLPILMTKMVVRCDSICFVCMYVLTPRTFFSRRNSIGWVYLRFDSVASATDCQRAMHGRWFAGRAISATFM